MTTLHTLGQRLGQARREKGVREARDVTLSEIAKAVGVTSTSVSEWEADKKSPREDALAKLAKFLGVTPAYLRYGVGAESASKSASLVTHDTEATRQRQSAKRDGGKQAAAGDRRGRGRPPKPR